MTERQDGLQQLINKKNLGLTGTPTHACQALAVPLGSTTMYHSSAACQYNGTVCQYTDTACSTS